MQKTTNYTGIWGGNEQDRSIQEQMGSIVDRSREHLGASDIPVIAARRLLIKMARDLEKGVEPACVQNVDAYFIRAWQVISSIDNFEELLRENDAELGVVPVQLRI
jgi:hypothetical protein